MYKDNVLVNNIGTIVVQTGGGRALIGNGRFKSAELYLSMADLGGCSTMDVKLQVDPNKPRVASGSQLQYDAGVMIRKAGNVNALLAVPFTPDRNMTLYSFGVVLSQNGSVAAGKIVNGLIVNDTGGGDPNIADIVDTGAAGLGYTCTRLAASTPAKPTWLDFFFFDGVDLTAGTPYWFVMTSDYNASDTINNSMWAKTVAGTSGCKTSTNGAVWSSLETGNKDIAIRINYLEFVDAVGPAITQLTAVGLPDVSQLKILGDYYNLTEYMAEAIRLHFTPDAGSALVISPFLQSGPDIKPADPD